MIIYKSGNLLEDDAEALVNTVNVVGVMGAGIALQFKEKYGQQFFDDYKLNCKCKLAGQIVSLWKAENGQTVINLATKSHWKDKSEFSKVSSSLKELLKLPFSTIALPKLGCGLGGLDWENKIKPICEVMLKESDIEFRIYV